MSRLGEMVTQQQALAHDLLQFYDELTAHHACSAFVMQALASALITGEGMDRRSATGAVFCTQWLDDRADKLERRIRYILSQLQASTTTTVPP